MFEIRDEASAEPVPRGAFLSVGNFDGVHRGHAGLIHRLREKAVAVGAPGIALTFDPHPVAVLRPCAAPPPLTWRERTVSLLHEAGADHVGIFRTGPWLLELSAREFFERIVLEKFEARGMVEGPNFYFGHDRAGNVSLLSHWCEEAGLEFEVARPVEAAGGIVSSSRIRRLLREGHAAEAAELLGRPHRLRGSVVRGAGRGVGLGFPTANLSAVDVQIPADGVYAARVIGHGSDAPPCPAAVHIGPNATFGEQDRTVEVHLIGFEGDLYGRSIEVDLLKRLRRTSTFESVEALIGQIKEDVAGALAIAGN